MFFSGIDWDPALEPPTAGTTELVAGASRARQTTRGIGNWTRSRNRLARSCKTSSWIVAVATQKISSPAIPADERDRSWVSTSVSVLLPAVRKVQDAADRGAQTSITSSLPSRLRSISETTAGTPTRLTSSHRSTSTSSRSTSSPASRCSTSRPPNGYLLYSVGPNGTDDGGHESTTTRRATTSSSECHRCRRSDHRYAAICPSPYSRGKEAANVPRR